MPYIPQPDEQLEFQIAFPDGQELYIFNKYGKHTMTKSIITGRTLYTFLYNVNTSFGKLSAVTDASGNKVSFIRDSGNSLHTIETTRGQKCRVVTNKQGFLEQFVNPDNLTTKFTYDPTGLLISRSDSAGHSFFYIYDQSGRLIRFVEPSGRATELNFDFSRHGALVSTVDSSSEYSSKKNTIVKVRGGSFTTYENGFELKTIVHLDGSVEVETPWHENIFWEAQPHKVLLSFLPVQAGMFPVLMRQTLFSSNSYKPWIGWDYDVKYNKRTEKDKNIAAVERILVINDTQYLSVEYDWIANREILYNNSRRPFLFVQYDDSSRPVQWLPKESRLPLNVMYDRFGRLSGWQQGPHSETYSYDRMGHLSEIRFSDSTSIKNSYESGKMSPNTVVLRSGRKYVYSYDDNGRLKSITTPKGTKHIFRLEISLGFYKLIYSPPGNNIIHYVIYMDEEKRPIMKVFPNDFGKIIYVYNNRSQLHEIVYGGGKIEKIYHKNGLLNKQLWRHEDSEIWLNYEYSGALLTKQSHIFVSSYLLSNLIFSYQYDSFGRLKLLSAKVGSISLPTIDYTYNQRTGRIEAIANFRYYDRSQNESFLTDGIATYSKTFDASHYLLQLSLVITDKEVFRMDLYHNSNGALVQSKTFMRHLGASKMRVQNYTYDNDNQLIEVTGKENAWKFSYDDNGNLATMQYMGNRIDILYDSGDRIVSFGDTPYITDVKGFVIQRGEERFTFNVLGQLLRVIRPSRYDVRYLYDSNGRLSVRKDSYGNVTQYFYGDILRPNLVTHTFNNADGRVTTIIYDDQNVPIMIQVCFIVVCLYVFEYLNFLNIKFENSLNLQIINEAD